MKAFFPYLLLSMAFLAMAIVLLAKSRRYDEMKLVHRRLEGVASAEQQVRLNWWQRQFDRAGLHVERARTIIILLLLPPVIAMFFSPVLGGIVLAAMIAGFIAFLQLRYRRRMQQLVGQLPRFLDHVVRGLHTGRTLSDAMFSANDEVKDPLNGIISRVHRNVSLGIGFPESFQEIADRYAVKELQILALGIRVNSQYGGNMSDLLTNIIRFINEREKMTGMLRAMTGETRVSAGVLAVVPTALAAYIMIMNPSYLVGMWNDPSGRGWILAALGLQLSGVMIIWRMMRSI